MPDKFNREKQQNTYKILHVGAKFCVQLYKANLKAAKIDRNGCECWEKLAGTKTPDPIRALPEGHE